VFRATRVVGECDSRQIAPKWSPIAGIVFRFETDESFETRYFPDADMLCYNGAYI